MSSEAAACLPVLSPNQRRVLGVLVEKAKTTPDAYPLSLNALVTGCNQKSNRDPLMELDEADLEETLASLGKDRLVLQVTGTRVDRWRHNLYESWKVDKVELAVLAELLLRGPQTEGELRGRASRMEPIADLAALRAVLQKMAQRQLIVYLTAEGRRGTVLSHGFHSPEELEQWKQAPRPEPDAIDEQTPPPVTTASQPRLDQLLDEIDAVKQRLSAVEARLEAVENAGKSNPSGTV